MTTLPVGRPRKDFYEQGGNSIQLPPRTSGIFFTMDGNNVIKEHISLDMHFIARKQLYNPTSKMQAALDKKTFSIKVAYDSGETLTEFTKLESILIEIKLKGYTEWFAHI